MGNLIKNYMDKKHVEKKKRMEQQHEEKKSELICATIIASATIVGSIILSCVGNKNHK